jgi:hypothetical protein
MQLRTINLRVDVATGRRVETNGSPDNRPLRLVRGDDVQLNIDTVVVEPTTQTATAYGWHPDTVFQAVAKKRGDYLGPELIVAGHSVWNQVTDRANASVAVGRLCVRLRLNFKALADALGGTSQSLPVVLDLEAITPEGAVSTFLQMEDRVLNDAARSPGALIAGGTEYLELEEFRALLREVTHPAGGLYRIEHGKLWLWDLGTEQFVAVALSDLALSTLEAS